MAYLTQDDLTDRVANLTDWAKNLADKITMTGVEIEKYLRNVKAMTDDQIDHLSVQSVADLVQPACCYCLYLCYMDQAEGNSDAYAAMGEFYKKQYEQEMGRLQLKYDGNYTPTTDDNIVLPSQGTVML